VIEYRDDSTTIAAGQLGGGYFDGWPSPPNAELHLAFLRGAEVAIVAFDAAAGQAVGFVTAIGDRRWSPDGFRPASRGAAGVSGQRYRRRIGAPGTGPPRRPLFDRPCLRSGVGSVLRAPQRSPRDRRDVAEPEGDAAVRPAEASSVSARYAHRA
jgi:hypothetical protein